MDLDIGLPIDRLRQPIRACLSGGVPFNEITVPARNRRGKDVTCLVACGPLGGADGDMRGVILLIEERTTSQEAPGE